MARHLIIGMGQIGKRHARLLEESGEQVYGYDIDFNTNKNIQTSVYDDYEEAYHKCPDMIWICTPTVFHYEYAIEAIREGKRVFIEKPITSAMVEALAIQKEGGNVWVACNYRFHPAVKVLKDNLDKVGKILYSRMHFSHYLPYQRDNWQEYMRDTNILMDVGWHFVDLAHWLFGKSLLFNHHFLSQPKDITQIRLTHRSDILTFIHLDYLRRDKAWGIEVVGEKGTLTLESHYRDPETVSVKYRNKSEMDVLIEMRCPSDAMYQEQIKYLLDNPQASNIDDAVEVMEVCL